jgi:hypothetical protein
MVEENLSSEGSPKEKNILHIHNQLCRMYYGTYRSPSDQALCSRLFLILIQSKAVIRIQCSVAHSCATSWCQVCHKFVLETVFKYSHIYYVKLIICQTTLLPVWSRGSSGSIVSD